MDWRNSKRKRVNVEQACITAAREFRPQLCFAQFQTHEAVTTAFPKVLKQLGCFSINWTGDVRHPLPQWYRGLAPHFDVTSFTNWTDVETVREMGHRSEFLQIGYDELLYNSNGTGERSGVVFIGNNYSGYKFAESEGRREMVRALAKAFPDDFTVHGMSWEGVCPAQNIGGYIREPGDAEILRRSLVAVGWDHFHRPGFASDRLLRATACGCAVVNQHYEGIEGEHPRVVSVKTVDEMVKAVGLLLENPEVARKLGEENAANTLEQHRWNERVKVIETWMR